jgi:putative inorganic carbon (hco3(-)) transporter
MNISLLTTRIIRGSFYLLFALVPLLLTPWNYELFEYNKMMAVYAITTVITTAWIAKMLYEKQIRIHRTPLDIPILLFVGSQLISSIFSIDPHVSWIGYYSRFNGGMWSILSYALLYFACTSTFTDESTASSHARESGSMNHEVRNKQKKKQNDSRHDSLFIIHNSIFTLFKIALTTASVVSLYGVAQRLGVDKHLWVQDVQNRVFSTLGQPNWLAAYLVALSPIAWTFALQMQNEKLKLKNYIWTCMAVLFFAVLLFTRSRSGLLAFAVADIIFWVALFFQKTLTIHTRRVFWIIHALFALIVFFNGSTIAQLDRYISLRGITEKLTKQHTPAPAEPIQTGPSLETGGTESGVIRTYVWQGAITAWQSSVKTLLIGTGTETFAFAFYQWRPVGHNLTSEWDFLYNKAHNEYLNYLTTTGILGLASYLLFIGSCIWWFIKKVHSSWVVAHSKSSTHKTTNDELRVTNYTSIALFAGWASILVTNFFGFSVVTQQLLLFLLPAFIFITHHPRPMLSKPINPASWVLGAMLIIGVGIIIRLATLWYADTRYASGYRLTRAGQYLTARDNLDAAIALNPMEPVYRDELANTLASLSVAAFEQNQATLSAELAQEALRQNDVSIRTSPANVAFWKTRTKIYYALSAFDPTLNDAAVTALDRARALSPNDPKIFYNLAILQGRSTDYQSAVTMLHKAIELKPNYRDAYYALYVFYTEMKQPAQARQILETYRTTIDANDSQFNELLQKQI